MPFVVVAALPVTFEDLPLGVVGHLGEQSLDPGGVDAGIPAQRQQRHPGATCVCAPVVAARTVARLVRDLLEVLVGHDAVDHLLPLILGPSAVRHVIGESHPGKTGPGTELPVPGPGVAAVRIGLTGKRLLRGLEGLRRELIFARDLVQERVPGRVPDRERCVELIPDPAEHHVAFRPHRSLPEGRHIRLAEDQARMLAQLDRHESLHFRRPFRLFAHSASRACEKCTHRHHDLRSSHISPPALRWVIGCRLLPRIPPALPPIRSRSAPAQLRLRRDEAQCSRETRRTEYRDGRRAARCRPS